VRSMVRVYIELMDRASIVALDFSRLSMALKLIPVMFLLLVLLCTVVLFLLLSLFPILVPQDDISGMREIVTWDGDVAGDFTWDGDVAEIWVSPPSV